MKKLSFLLFVLYGLIFFASCDRQETYAEERKRENSAINQYINKHNITVISEADFKAKGCVTDTAKNEFVLFSNTGIYMQILEKGCGSKLQNKETAIVLCRFNEYNLLTDTMQLSNNYLDYSAVVDKMTVRNNNGTFTASFDANSSVMYRAYGTTSVPAGWLTPLTYINIGRPENETDKIASVKVIVPSTQGTSSAVASVTPCLYEITYQRGK